MRHDSITCFSPHPWFPGPHRQTIAGAYLWRRLPYRATPRTVLLADGDRLVMHQDTPAAGGEASRAALLVHGLAGCHASGYMSRVAAKLVRAGFEVFRLDMRGCGAGWALARQSLHAGRIDDVWSAAAEVQRLRPKVRLTLVGFSLGASLVLKLLGTRDATCVGVDSAIAVAPPLDLQACSRNLQTGWNRLYDRSFVRILCRLVELRRRAVPELEHVRWPRRPRTLYEFDSLFTAPLGGFRDVEDYYQRCSTLTDLPQIGVATRILFAEDDPLVPADVFRQARFASQTEVVGTPTGGHLGFLAERSGVGTDADWHWMDWRVVEWVRDFASGDTS